MTQHVKRFRRRRAVVSVLASSWITGWELASTRLRPALCLLLLVCAPAPAPAATVSLAWTASVDAAGYRVQYGPTSGVWPTSVDVGNVTLATVTLVPGAYYFTVVAYNGVGVSGPSAEVFGVIGLVDMACDYPLGSKTVSIFPTALQKTGSGGAGSKARLDFQLASPGSPITRVAVRTQGADLRAMTGPATATAGVDDLAALAGLWFTVPAAPATYAFAIAATNAYGCTREQSTTFAITVK